MLLLLRSKIFLSLHLGRHAKLNGISLELGFGIVVINHFTFVSVKSGLTSLLKRCDKHFGPMTWHDWVWLGLPLVRQVKTAKLSSNMLKSFGSWKSPQS